MNSIPQIIGESIFAAKNDVEAYSSPNVNSLKYADEKTKGEGIFWGIDSVIGTFTGDQQIIANQVWYKVDYVIYRRAIASFFPWGKPTYKFSTYKANNTYSTYPDSAWFRGEDVAVQTQEAIQVAKDEMIDKDGNGIPDYLDDLLKGDEGGTTDPGATTGNKGLGASLVPQIYTTDEEGNQTLNLTLVLSIAIAAVVAIGAWMKWGGSIKAKFKKQ